MQNDLVEIVARALALHEDEQIDCDEPMIGSGRPSWVLYEDTAQAALSALKSAGVVTQGWQDIASAPTDWSEDVDLWVLSPYGDARVTNCRASLTNGKPNWHTRCDERGWTPVEGTPTHWRPLPTPPLQAARGGA
jgi:hypothetical protein